MPKPPMTRHMARSQRAKGRAEPRALAVKRTAAICMQRMRPIRSARRPAVAAPKAQPISAAAITWASTAEPTSKRSRMASTAPLMTELS